MENITKILGRWYVLETWKEDEEDKIDEYKVDIEQDSQSIILDIERAKERSHGDLKGRVLKYQYRYEDGHGITENTCEVIFSEDFSSGNYKSRWHCSDGCSGPSDGKWLRGVSNIQDIIVNIKKLEEYKKLLPRSSKNEFFNDRIQAGRCFVVYRTTEGLCFAPSKFIGYQHNDKEVYLATRSELRSGTITNRLIEKILGKKQESDELNKKHASYCRDKCDREPYKHKHTFWDRREDIII